MLASSRRAASCSPAVSRADSSPASRGDLAEAVGDRGLEVGRDAHPLLLGGVAQVALALALPARRLRLECPMQPRLPLRPPADEERQPDGDEGQTAAGGPSTAGSNAMRIAAMPAASSAAAASPRGRRDVSAGAVDRDQDGDQRRHGLGGEEVAGDRLDEQPGGDRGEREQRHVATQGERKRRDGDGEHPHQPDVAVDGRERRLELARRGERQREQEVQPGRRAAARDDAQDLPHRANVAPVRRPVLLRGDEAALLLR